MVFQGIFVFLGYSVWMCLGMRASVYISVWWCVCVCVCWAGNEVGEERRGEERIGEDRERKANETRSSRQTGQECGSVSRCVGVFVCVWGGGGRGHVFCV